MTGAFPVEYNINAVQEQQKNKTKQNKTKNNKKDPGKLRNLLCIIVIYSYSSRFYAINTVPVKGKLTVLRSSKLDPRKFLL